MPDQPSITKPEEVPLLLIRMSEAEFDAGLFKLRETYGGSSRKAAAKRDQKFALFLCASNWTMNELTAKVGKSRQWVFLRLRLGRFLNFATTVAFPESLSNDLTESRFHSFWERTQASMNERVRFRKVVALMNEATTSAQRSRPA